MEGRNWRTIAQRNSRNNWSSIAAACSDWKSSSSRSLAAATSLLNAFIVHRNLSAVTFGVLHDMKGIRENAQEKLARQQIAHLQVFLNCYQELVPITSRLIQLANAMRVYAKDSAGSPMATFSKERLFDDDTGDGQGRPVFSVLTIKCFEDLAQEIVNMYLLELSNKWLLASEFNSIVHNERRCLALDDFQSVALRQTFLEKDTKQLDSKPEVLEVYLACWLTEVNIDVQRVKEIVHLVGEEMQVQLQLNV